MRLALVFLLIGTGVCSAGATLYSQSTYLSVSLDNKSVREVLDEIENNSEYIFFYYDDIVDTKRIVSIHVKNRTIDKILDRLFEGTGNTYVIDDRQIIISQKEPVAETAVRQQARTITGTVTDEMNEPVAGANIVIKGTTVGTTTGVDGKFTLSTTVSGPVLIISYVGYLTQEIAVGKSDSPINIRLSESDQALEEIVVVGYGIQKKVNLSGSVAQIDSKALSNRPIQNVSSALQGLMTGVTALSGDGRPGGDNATIRVRGLGTLNTGYASPYVLIDGVESGTMNSLDPNDIESISVLKDASSAAIYGSKASNGVILITTRRGKSGDKPRISYNGFYSVQSATKLIDRLSSYDYARLLAGAQADDGLTPRFTDEDLKLFKDGSDPYGHPDTDWYGLAFKNGAQHQHNINVSGGAGNATYMASAGFLGQEGILPNSDRQQFNGRTNLDLKLSDRFALRMSLAYINNSYSDPTNSYVRDGSDQIVRQLNVIAPWIPNKDANGDYGTISDGNPIAWLDMDQTLDRREQNFTGIFAADYTVTPGLKLTVQEAYTSNIQHYREFVKDIWYNPSKYHGPNQLDERLYLWNRNNFDAYLNYDKLFGAHGLKVMLGWHAEKYNYAENKAVRKNFPNNELTDMNAGATSSQTNEGFTRQLAMVSGFGRINYDYAGRYLVEANFRADASSRFARENRWGYFPSFSAAWRISEEGFMESYRDVVNNLKLRTSWGLLGDQAANGDYYPYLNTYSLDGTYPFGGTLQTGYYQKAFKIESFSWEKSRTWGIGADFTLFHTINATIDYYDRKTTDIIMEVPVPEEFGLGAYLDNVGAVSNKGLEVSLGYNNRWGDFSFGAVANVSYNKNKILDLGLNDADGIIIDSSNSNLARKVGHQINAYYVYKTDGIFRSQDEVDAFTAKYNRETGTTMFSRTFNPGDIRYVDVNGDGKINSNDRVLCNSTTPAYIFGLNLTGEYRQFDLSAILSGAAKVARIYNDQVFGSFTGDASHPSTWWLDAWTPENKNSDVPRIWNDRNSNSDSRNVMSDFWVQNTSYLRIKNLQLGYTFPKSFIRKSGISNLRVYYSGENLFTFDALPVNIDPEISSERASSYPLIRTHAIGVNVTF
jgi:TonB-linked SusC/RagA family outer membrane protein